jgi:hypothetical protein
MFKTMPFGKHKGTPLRQLPADYVQWMLLQKWVSADLRSALRDHPGLEHLYRETVAADRRRPKKRYTKPFSLPAGFNLKPRLQQAKRPVGPK